jgi:6-phosphogluconolactonase
MSQASQRFSRRDVMRGLAAAPLMFAGGISRRGVWYAGLANLIQVMRVDGETFEHRQSIESIRPAALTVHPNGRYLYAANDVAEHAGLSRGTVEAFAINAKMGTLTRIGKQPLSLSATGPRGIAIAPNGGYLIVAAYEGGIYNALPIDGEGKLGSVSAIRKEVGAGAHPERQLSAHPHSVIFDRAGRYAISSDLGCDWVSVWRVEKNRFTRVNRTRLAPGAGPGAIALDADGKLLNIGHEMAGLVSTHRYSSETGEIGPAIRRSASESDVIKCKLPSGETPLSVAFLAS